MKRIFEALLSTDRVKAYKPDPRAYGRTRSGRNQVFSEIADLHVATLASSSPVDVISTDRHTVKP
jgi:hypothetical protein